MKGAGGIAGLNKRGTQQQEVIPSYGGESTDCARPEYSPSYRRQQFAKHGIRHDNSDFQKATDYANA